MKLKQYLTETMPPAFSEIVPILEKNCKPMMRVYKKTVKMYSNREDMFCWRSTTLSNGIYEVKRRRKNRKPRNTDVKVTATLDKEFKQQHGWKPRTEGVFTSSMSNAEGYGPNMCMFFPFGNLDYLHAPGIGDLFIQSSMYGVDSSHHTGAESSYRNLVKKYKDTGLIVGLKDEDEFMFNCDKYLVVDKYYLHEMVNYLEFGII